MVSRSNSAHSQSRMVYDEVHNSSFNKLEDPATSSTNYSQLMKKLRRAAVWPRDVPVVLQANKPQEKCQPSQQALPQVQQQVQQQKRHKPRVQSGAAVAQIHNEHDLRQKASPAMPVLIRSKSSRRIRQNTLERKLLQIPRYREAMH